MFKFVLYVGIYIPIKCMCQHHALKVLIKLYYINGLWVKDPFQMVLSKYDTLVIMGITPSYYICY